MTVDDTLDAVVRHFGDARVYDDVEDALAEGRITLRECIEREFAPVTASVEDVVVWTLAHARIRLGLPELAEGARRGGWDVRIVSSGFEELIGPLLEREGVSLPVLANRLDTAGGNWRVLWRDGTICAECGQPCKRAALPAGEVAFVGDGYSDRCAALAADRVFATRGLAAWLDERRVPYEPFADFHDVLGRL